MKQTSKTPSTKRVADKSRALDSAKWQADADRRAVDGQEFLAMCDWAHSGSGIKNILSLPGRDWLWERSFTTVYPDLRLHIHGIERDRRAWKAMSEMASKLDKINKHQKFSAESASVEYARFLRTTQERFDMINLNWKAPWSDDRQRQVETLLNQNLLKPGGLLRITTSQGGAGEIGSEYPPQIFGYQDSLGGEGSSPQIVHYGVAGQILKIGDEMETQLRVISDFTYCCDNQLRQTGTTECSALLRVM